MNKISIIKIFRKQNNIYHIFIFKKSLIFWNLFIFQVLYDIVEAIEEKIFEENDEFDIIQPFPFKIFSDKNKTIEEEKLYPNAMLQIREKELD